MKNLISKIKNNKIFYVFLLFIVAMFPSAFYTKAEYQQRAILVSIAIDKNEDKFDLNAMLVVPSSAGNLNSNIEIVSGEGKTVSEALHVITTDLGKKVSLAHCDTIFVNDDLLKNEDISRVLDHFVRGANNTKNSIIIGIEGKGKDLLETIKNLKEVNSFLASDLVNSENNLIGITNVSIKEFYKDYFTPGQVSVMSVLTLKDESGEQSGGSQNGSGSEQSGVDSGGQTGGSSSGESSGGSQGSKSKELRSENKLALLKKGKQVALLENEQSDFYNLINDKAKTDFINLNNLDFKIDDAKVSDLGVEIVEKKVKKRYNIKDGKPRLVCDIEIIVKLTEIVHEGNIKVNSINGVRTHVNDDVEKAIKEYYDKGLQELVTISKENNVDVFEFNEKLNKFKNKKWKEFLQSINNEEDYLQDIAVELNLRIKSKF